MNLCPLHCRGKCDWCPYQDDRIAYIKEQDEIIEFMEEKQKEILNDKERKSLN